MNRFTRLALLCALVLGALCPVANAKPAFNIRTSKIQFIIQPPKCTGSMANCFNFHPKGGR